MTKAIKNSNYKQAIKIGLELLNKYGSNPEVNYLLGESYYAIGQNAAALAEFQKTTQREISSRIIKYTTLHERLAELYTKTSNYEEASKEYLDLLNKDPKNLEYNYQLGILSEKRGKYDLATKFYNKTLSIKANHVPSLVSLGVIYACQKKFQDANFFLTKARKYESNNAKALFYLGLVKKNLGDTNEAFKLFEQSARDKEYKVRSLIERGRILYCKNKFEDATIEFERALKNIDNVNESRNTVLNVRYLLATCYENIHNLDKAIPHLEEIYKISPHFKDVADKLDTYEDIKLGDEMKDFMTAADSEFITLCKSIVTQKMQKNVTELQPIGKDAIQLVTNDSEWMGAKKRTEIIRIYRINSPINENEVATCLDFAKTRGATKATIMTSGSFTKQAQAYAQERPIQLMDKAQLTKLICSTHHSNKS